MNLKWWDEMDQIFFDGLMSDGFLLVGCYVTCNLVKKWSAYLCKCYTYTRACGMLSGLTVRQIF